MSDGPSGSPPQYKVYRSRRRLLDALKPSEGLEGLRERRRKPAGPREPRRRERRQPITAKRVAKWVALAVLGWIGLSLVLFLLSAQLAEDVSERAEEALSGGGTVLTGSTILVLGSDQRPKGTRGPEAGPGRADSIILLRVGLGTVRTVSILRDSFAEIPGSTPQKINAAYAIGGAGLMVDTVERFMGNGLEINHLVEIDFREFPELIDALGGITVESRSRICAPPFDNFTSTLNFKRGENEVDGRRALGFARVRTNPCSPGEDDRARARRQQEVFKAIRRELLSPSTFFRLPWVSWRAPKTLRTDMGGPALLGLFTDLASTTVEQTPVLGFSCLGCGPGNSAVIPDEAKREAVRKLLGR